MATKLAPASFTVIEATSKTGNAWLKLAPVLQDGTVDVEYASYLVPVRRDNMLALRASLRVVYDALTEHIDAAPVVTVVAAPTPAPAAQDTRVEALSAKVDALTDAMTALAQLVARTTGPTVLAPAPAAPPANGKRAKAATPAPAAEAPAKNPLADLPF